VAALRRGLADGTIDAVASDHAPHEHDSKRIEFSKAAFGILGLQTSLPIVLELIRDGTLSRRRAIEVCTAGPARCFDLPYGTLAVGACADVTIIDPERRWVFDRAAVASLSANSPFLDRELRGAAETVVVAGTLVLHDGSLRRQP
jgi:dihydroorotase